MSKIDSCAVAKDVETGLGIRQTVEYSYQVYVFDRGRQDFLGGVTTLVEAINVCDATFCEHGLTCVVLLKLVHEHGLYRRRFRSSGSLLQLQKTLHTQPPWAMTFDANVELSKTDYFWPPLYGARDCECLMRVISCEQIVCARSDEPPPNRTIHYTYAEFVPQDTLELSHHEVGWDGRAQKLTYYRPRVDERFVWSKEYEVEYPNHLGADQETLQIRVTK